MHNRTKTILASVSVAALIVVGTDAMTYAGTGDSLILGHGNKSNTTTHVKTTSDGPALSLHAKGKRPALAVDSNAKVVRLNADTVDGKSAAALRNNVRVYTATSGESDFGALLLELPNFPKGRYVATYSAYLSGAYGSTSDPTQSYCIFYESGNNPEASGFATTVTVGLTSPGLSSSDTINKDTDRWRLFCEAYQEGAGPHEWTIHPDRPIRVTLTRIDKTIGGNLATARNGPDAHLTTR